MICPFKVGERIVCIKLSPNNGGIVIDHNNLGKVYIIHFIHLTTGKKFPIIEDLNGNRYLGGDWECYISLSEQRRLKLEKLKDV